MSDCPAETSKNMMRPIILEKRKNDRENEVRKIITPTEFIPNEYGDRFFARRYAFKNHNDFVPGHSSNSTDKTSKYYDFVRMISVESYWRTHLYQTALFNAFFPTKPGRHLQFSDTLIRTPLMKTHNLFPNKFMHQPGYENPQKFDWPCKPRRSPIAFSLSTHDLPGFGTTLENGLISWCELGQIAALFHEEMVIWDPKLEETVMFKMKNITAMAYMPGKKAKVLAMGGRRDGKPGLELWLQNHEGYLSILTYYKFRSQFGDIHCIEWNSKGNKIVCGLKCGRIFVLHVERNGLHLQHFLQHSLGRSIENVKFSPNSMHLANSDRNGNVSVISLDSLEIKVSIQKDKRKCGSLLAWHPWSSVDLIVCEKCPAKIFVININTNTCVARYEREDRICRFDSVSFNKLTAELVVAVTTRDASGCRYNDIIVLASLDQVVDVLKGHDDIVKHLLWSADGKQLVTAGNDEVLNRWEFLPNLQRNLKEQKLTQKKYNGNLASIFDLFVSIK